MAGKKGKSGRKPRWFEAKYELLEGLCVDRALAIMKIKFKDIVDAPEEKKADMILDFKQQNKIMLSVIEKGLPQRIKLDGNIKHEGEVDHYHKLAGSELDNLEAGILGSRLRGAGASTN